MSLLAKYSVGFWGTDFEGWGGLFKYEMRGRITTVFLLCIWVTYSTAHWDAEVKAPQAGSLYLGVHAPHCLLVINELAHSPRGTTVICMPAISLANPAIWQGLSTTFLLFRHSQWLFHAARASIGTVYPYVIVLSGISRPPLTELPGSEWRSGAAPL